MATGGDDDNNGPPNRKRWRKRESTGLTEDDTDIVTSKVSRTSSQISTESSDSNSATTSNDTTSTTTSRSSYSPIIIGLTTPPVTTALEARHTEPPRTGTATVHISITGDNIPSAHHTITQDIPIRIINRLDHSPVATPHNYDLRPRRPPETTTTNDESNSVIIVDSDSEDETDDVIIVRESPPHRITQHIQDIFDHSVIPDEQETFGTTISVRTIEREQDDTQRHVPHHSDALGVLMVAALPHSTGAHTFVRHIVDRAGTHGHHPLHLLHSIIGPGGPLFGGTMGSYEDLLELAERLGPGRSLGLPDDVIDAIPVRTYSKTNEETNDPCKLNCVVCMMDYEDGDNIKTLSCSHEFHTNCISPWLKQRRTCPICRNDLTTT